MGVGGGESVRGQCGWGEDGERWWRRDELRQVVGLGGCPSRVSLAEVDRGVLYKHPTNCLMHRE